jgi:cytochrome c peroxidase
MHNGSLATLEQVIRFYNQGGFSNETQDPLIKPLSLSEQEINHLVEFLKSLTGSNVQELIADAYAEPVGDSIKIQ